MDSKWNIKPDLSHAVDENFSEALDSYACSANFAFVTGQQSVCSDSLVRLYNLVHGYNSHRLLSLDPQKGQTLGLAFVKMALYFSNGDNTVNEIAAQNAYYCLAKNIIVCENTFAAAPLFSLLYKKPRLLGDELKALVNEPMMPFENPMHRFYKGQECVFPLLKYLLTLFYDNEQSKFTIDETLPYHLPTHDEVRKLQDLLNKRNILHDNKALNIGKDYFVEVFNSIVESLENL